MADYVVNRESFEFTYSAKQREEVEKIRNLVVGMAYPIYKKITKKERAKIVEEMIALSNELFV